MTAGPLLLDTNAAIFLAEDMLQPAVLEVIIQGAIAGGLLLSPVTAWEIGRLCQPRRNAPSRLTLDPSPELWFAKLLNQPTVRMTPLTATAALASSMLPGEFHDDPADRLLVATARELGVPLVTRDRSIIDYAAAGHLLVLPC